MKQFTLALIIACSSLTAMSQTQECVKDTNLYVEKEQWYIKNEPIQLNGKKYVKYGLPTVHKATEIKAAGNYKKTSVYVDTGFEGVPDVLYIPIRKGCEFQSYLMVVSECNIEVKITSELKTTDTAKLYVFNAAASSKYPQLDYSWMVSLQNKDGSDVEDAPNIATLIIGSTNDKKLVVSTKGLKKGTIMVAQVFISAREVDCKPKQVNTQITIP